MMSNFGNFNLHWCLWSISSHEMEMTFYDSILHTYDVKTMVIRINDKDDIAMHILELTNLNSDKLV